MFALRSKKTSVHNAQMFSLFFHALTEIIILKCKNISILSKAIRSKINEDLAYNNKNYEYIKKLQL